MANLTGGIGDDTLNGGSENDIILGNAGDDTLSGGGGNDKLVGGAGGDFLDGGDGDDQLFSYIADPNFTFYFYAGVSLDIYTDVDVLIGGAGDDSIFAGYGDFVDGGTKGAYGDYLYISFLGAPSGVNADFRVLQSGGTLTIGGATIKNITNIGYLEGSNFDDLLVPIDTYYPAGASVFGRGGNDHIIASYYSGWGSGGLYGGDGDDIVDARPAQYNPDVYGDAGNDTLYTSGSWGRAFGGDGNDLIYTSGSAFGGSGNDTITLSYGYYGTTASGDAGDDVIDGSAAAAFTASGGTGADVITGSALNDILYTGDAPLPGSVTFFSTDNGSEYDVINAGGGDDTISAGYGDTVDGGAGSDKLRLSLAGFGAGITFSTAGIASGAEIFIGGGSIKNIEDLDYLSATQFADRLTLAPQASLLTVDAGAGDDVIIATTSSTRVYGGAGNDRFFSGTAGDIFDGGIGSDTVDYSNFATGVSITLATGGSATGPGGDQMSGIENLTGSSFNDTLTGNNTDNVLSGGAGDDTLSGGAGNDRLEGGSGVDSLRGGVGVDVLIGGVGADGFIGTASELNGDTIADFTPIDRIVITDAVLSSFTYSLSGSTLAYSGGSLTFGSAIDRAIVASAAPEGGVQLTLGAATTPTPPPPTAPSARARLTLTEAGQDFTVGGNVEVIGTTTSGEVVRVTSGDVLLDPSFNTGGDTVVLMGDAYSYSAVRTGSTVTIYGSDASVSIPIGLTGVTVQFADSTRILRFDTQLGQTILGSQQVTSTPVEVSASGPALAALVESGPASLGRLTLTQPGQDVEIGGNVTVIGTTSGDEVITVRGGTVTFDPSFNAGGDMVVLSGSSGSYSGNLSGANAILSNGLANVSVPVGTNGMVVMFDDRSATLRFDSVAGKVVLGDFILSSTSSRVVLSTASALSTSVAEMMDSSSDYSVGSLGYASSATDPMTTNSGLWFA